MKSAGNLATRVIKTAVDWTNSGMALECFLAGRFTYRSQAEWRERILSGEITINGAMVAPEYLLQLHDIIEYRPGDIPEPPVDLTCQVVFEDEFLLVVNKSGNLPVHPSGPYFRHTLWHLLRSDFPEIHLINRLDRETSGLLIAAKNAKVAATLAKDRDIEKSYLALVFGKFPKESQASGFLVADTVSAVRKKRRFVAGAVPPPGAVAIERAETCLELEQGNERFSLVRATLGTGRMHQIRATLFSLGFPLVGDKLYGPDETIFLKLRANQITDADYEKLRMRRQALHAGRLRFRHPVSGEEMSFTAPLPEDFQQCLNSCLTPEV